MTFFHFINCVALSYVPHAIVYKTSGLSEYGVYWKCVQAAFMYLFTQFIKMLLLATFFPESDNTSTNLDIIGEFLRCSVDLGDLLGLYFIMSRLAVKGPLKFTSAALGWATAEFITTRLVPFWVGARGTEFDWVYIQMGFETNIRLVQHIATAALVWLYGRYDLGEGYKYIAASLLLFTTYKPLLVQIITTALSLGPWTMLGIKLVSTIMVAAMALPIYGKINVVAY